MRDLFFTNLANLGQFRRCEDLKNRKNKCKQKLK